MFPAFEPVMSSMLMTGVGSNEEFSLGGSFQLQFHMLIFKLCKYSTTDSLNDQWNNGLIMRLQNLRDFWKIKFINIFSVENG